MCEPFAGCAGGRNARGGAAGDLKNADEFDGPAKAGIEGIGASDSPLMFICMDDWPN